MLLEPVWKRFLRRKGFSPWVLLVPVMWFISVIYGLVVKSHRKSAQAGPKLSVPVISIGNIGIGGTGKTPMVEFLARFLMEDGFRVGVVSSGWGRKSDQPFIQPGYKVEEMPVDETGDEVKLLAMLLPNAIFSVAPVKAEAAAALAKSNEVDLIIVDDGFQHWGLHRDFDIVTFDAAVKRQVWHLFPHGRLREPFSALSEADVVIITRSNFAKDLTKLQAHLRKYSGKAELYHAGFSVDELVGRENRMSVKFLDDKAVTIFAGIGNFRSFRKQVALLSGSIDEAIELSDHQDYDQELLEKIAQTAKKHNSDAIVTTGKDWVKLGDFDFGRDIYYLAQTIDLDPGEEKLVRRIKEKLGLVRTKRT